MLVNVLCCGALFWYQQSGNGGAWRRSVEGGGGRPTVAEAGGGRRGSAKVGRGRRRSEEFGGDRQRSVEVGGGQRKSAEAGGGGRRSFVRGRRFGCRLLRDAWRAGVSGKFSARASDGDPPGAQLGGARATGSPCTRPITHVRLAIQVSIWRPELFWRLPSSGDLNCGMGNSGLHLGTWIFSHGRQMATWIAQSAIQVAIWGQTPK